MIRRNTAITTNISLIPQINKPEAATQKLNTPNIKLPFHRATLNVLMSPVGTGAAIAACGITSFFMNSCSKEAFQAQPVKIVRGFNDLQFNLQFAITNMINNGCNEITLQIPKSKEEEHKPIIKEIIQNINSKRVEQNLQEVHFVIGQIDGDFFNPQRNAKAFLVRNRRFAVVNGTGIAGWQTN